MPGDRPDGTPDTPEKVAQGESNDETSVSDLDVIDGQPGDRVDEDEGLDQARRPGSDGAGDAAPDRPDESAGARLERLTEKPEVRQHLDAAYADSQADDPDRRHEEGGWIIHADASDTTRVERVPPGERAGINPGRQPDMDEGEELAGFFHTHPNPEVDENGKEWKQGPSRRDEQVHQQMGIPGCIVNAEGVEVFDPAGQRKMESDTGRDEEQNR